MVAINPLRSRQGRLLLLGTAIGTAVIVGGLVLRVGPFGRGTLPAAGGHPDRRTILDFSHGQGISVDDAASAFRDTKTILDFQGRWSNDPRFGDVWVTYGVGYRVHVRSLDSSFDDVVGELQRSLGRAVVRHHGGASALQMKTLIDRLRLQTPGVAFRTNVQDGVIEVYESSAPNLHASPGDSAFIRIVPGSPPVVQPQPSPGRA